MQKMQNRNEKLIICQKRAPFVRFDPNMTSVMDGMQDIIFGTRLCHEKCKRVHLMVKVAHATKEHLSGFFCLEPDLTAT